MASALQRGQLRPGGALCKGRGMVGIKRCVWSFGGTTMSPEPPSLYQEHLEVSSWQGQPFASLPQGFQMPKLEHPCPSPIPDPALWARLLSEQSAVRLLPWEALLLGLGLGNSHVCQAGRSFRQLEVNWPLPLP